jgi:hypothetical protein
LPYSTAVVAPDGLFVFVGSHDGRMLVGFAMKLELSEALTPALPVKDGTIILRRRNGLANARESAKSKKDREDKPKWINENQTFWEVSKQVVIWKVPRLDVDVTLQYILIAAVGIFFTIVFSLLLVGRK